jgi:hypothetical protein
LRYCQRTILPPVNTWYRWNLLAACFVTLNTFIALKIKQK